MSKGWKKIKKGENVMSIRNVENFYLKVKQDIELKEKLEQIKKKLETDKKEVSLDDLEQKIISLAHEYDCDFTKEELGEYLKKVKSQMNEEELSEISAGVSKRLAVLGLSGALLASLCTGVALNIGVNKFESIQEQKNKDVERRREVQEKRSKDKKDREKNIKNKKENIKNESSTLLFKASAK